MCFRCRVIFFCSVIPSLSITIAFLIVLLLLESMDAISLSNNVYPCFFAQSNLFKNRIIGYLFMESQLNIIKRKNLCKELERTLTKQFTQNQVCYNIYNTKLHKVNLKRFI